MLSHSTPTTALYFVNVHENYPRASDPMIMFRIFKLDQCFRYVWVRWSQHQIYIRDTHYVYHHTLHTKQGLQYLRLYRTYNTLWVWWDLILKIEAVSNNLFQPSEHLQMHPFSRLKVIKSVCICPHQPLSHGHNVYTPRGRRDTIITRH